MSDNTHALRCADRLTLNDYYEFDASLHCPEAATHIRRLVAENEALRRERDHNLDSINVGNNIINKYRALNAELVEALRAMLTHMGMDEDDWNKPTFDQARAVLAKVGASK